MPNTVYQSGRMAHKPVARKAVKAAIRLTHESRQLRTHNVSTPLHCYDTTRQELLCEWIDSITAADRLRQILHQNPIKHPELSVFMASLMTALHQLHRVPADCLALRPLDVTRRIAPRLETPGANTSLFRYFLKLRSELKAFSGLTPDHPVHGDLHVGQLLIDKNDQVWIVDLDDLATGQIESDLGNFCAHLASHPEFTFNGILSSWDYWSKIVMHSYQVSSGCPPNWKCMRLYGALALLRRALKITERAGDNIDYQSCLPEQIIHASRQLFFAAMTTPANPIHHC